MNIAFHYFVVKTLADAAGYSEWDAQTIASYSQFVGEFNYRAGIRCRNIPPELYEPGLDIVCNKSSGIINPVMTGYYTTDDFLLLDTSRMQKLTVTPFHFIPMTKERMEMGKLRTVPATLDDGSFISDHLAALREKILSQESPTHNDLICMGMLLHTFADTYAHQLFSGCWDTTNKVTLKGVTDNIIEWDVTARYKANIEELAELFKKNKKELPSVGHMTLNRIPDLTHLVFEMDYTLDGEVYTYSRSNVTEFLSAAKAVYTYLCSCLKDGWKLRWDSLSPILVKGFFCDITRELNRSEAYAVPNLTHCWNKLFSHIHYEYDGDTLIKRLLGKIQAVVTSNGEEIACIEVKRDGSFDSVAFRSSRVASGVSEDEFRAALKIALNKDYLRRSNKLESNDLSEADARVNDMFDIFISYECSDDFYTFNYYADKFLIDLYGDNPREEKK